MINLIEAAIAPIKADAVLLAAKNANATIKSIIAKLDEHAWDVNAAYPVPRDCWHADYKSSRVLLARARTITTHTSGIQRPNGPCFRLRSAANEALFVKSAEEMAAVNYDRFVEKLVQKIGAGVVSATIEGNHVWGHSILTVTKEDGSVERWKTQTILNFSVHGTPFNQWPSRKVR